MSSFSSTYRCWERRNYPLPLYVVLADLKFINEVNMRQSSRRKIKEKFNNISTWERGFLGGSVVKNLPASAGDASSILGSERSPGERNGKPLQYSCQEKSHGQSSLASYSPQSPKGVGHDWACTHAHTYNTTHQGSLISLSSVKCLWHLAVFTSPEQAHICRVNDQHRGSG